MIKYRQLFLIGLLAVVVVMVPMGRFAHAKNESGSPSTFDYFIDAIVYRPLGIGATALGLGLFIIYSPIALAYDEVSDQYQKMVVRPFNYTFRRPLGKEYD